MCAWLTRGRGYLLSEGAEVVLLAAGTAVLAAGDTLVSVTLTARHFEALAASHARLLAPGVTAVDDGAWRTLLTLSRVHVDVVVLRTRHAPVTHTEYHDDNAMVSRDKDMTMTFVRTLLFFLCDLIV